MSNEKISFTAFLQDDYSKSFDKLAEHTDRALKGIDKDLNKLSKTGKMAAMSIEQLDKRIDHLTKAKKLSIDLSAINAANKEIRVLQKEKDRLEGGGSGSGNVGMMGMGSGFAVIGGAYAMAAAIKSVGTSVVDTASKYERYEAVLTNTLQSQTEAKQRMQEITDFAARTPFQIDELTGSFVKLVNQGFKPTMPQMTLLGDLASSTGKSFDQLTEAILDAQTGEFERLKEFGILASKQGGKVTFMFKEQKKVVDFNASSIRNYILSLGDAVGVSGAMAAISKTTGGQISNLSDSLDGVYKALGERFKPEMDSSIGVMGSMLAYAKDLATVPLEDKINAEAVKLRVLQTELNSTNTTEARRKEILDELERINPAIVDGINKEAIAYDKLNDNISKVVDNLRKKAVAAAMEGMLSESMNRIQDNIKGQVNIAGEAAKIAEKHGLSGIMNDRNADDGMKIQRLQNALEDKGLTANSNSDVYFLQQYKQQYDLNQKVISDQMEVTQNVQKKLSDFNNANGLSAYGDGQDGKPGKKNNGNTNTITSGKGSGSSSSGNGSISGSGRVTNMQISIQNLVGGGVNIYSTTLREGMSKAKDIVTEGLLSAVNDANLAAGK